MNQTKTLISSADDLEIIAADDTFGSYLRKIRSYNGISIRRLAKQLDITPTYLSDIENGNNKPPEKVLLLKIIDQLGLDSFPKIKSNLFDLAAKARNDIPADVKEYILNNNDILQAIREAKEQTNSNSEIRDRILKKNRR